MLLIATKYVLLWVLLTDPSVAIDSGAAPGFKSRAACEAAGAKLIDHAWPAHVEWSCEPDYIKPTVSG